MARASRKDQGRAEEGRRALRLAARGRGPPQALFTRAGEGVSPTSRLAAAEARSELWASQWGVLCAEKPPGGEAAAPVLRRGRGAGLAGPSAGAAVQRWARSFTVRRRRQALLRVLRGGARPPPGPPGSGCARVHPAVHHAAVRGRAALLAAARRRRVAAALLAAAEFRDGVLEAEERSDELRERGQRRTGRPARGLQFRRPPSTHMAPFVRNSVGSDMSAWSAGNNREAPAF